MVQLVRVFGNTRWEFPAYAMISQRNTKVGVFWDEHKIYKGFGDPIWNKLDIYIAMSISLV